MTLDGVIIVRAIKRDLLIYTERTFVRSFFWSLCGEYTTDLVSLSGVLSVEKLRKDLIRVRKNMCQPDELDIQRLGCREGETMTQTKCTGCKVFTLCLGDPRGFIREGPIRQCYYCGKYYFRETSFSFPDGTFCEEFYTTADTFYPDEIERLARKGDATLACNAERCQKLSGKAPGWTRHHGFAINRNALKRKIKNGSQN